MELLSIGVYEFMPVVHSGSSTFVETRLFSYGYVPLCFAFCSVSCVLILEIVALTICYTYKCSIERHTK